MKVKTPLPHLDWFAGFGEGWKPSILETKTELEFIMEALGDPEPENSWYFVGGPTVNKQQIYPHLKPWGRLADDGSGDEPGYLLICCTYYIYKPINC